MWIRTACYSFALPPLPHGAPPDTRVPQPAAQEARRPGRQHRRRAGRTGRGHGGDDVRCARCRPRRHPGGRRPAGHRARPALAPEARPLPRAPAQARAPGAPERRPASTPHLTTWRIVFMGTPAFACPILEALLARADPVVGVVCQPDRPRGRGLEVAAPEVKRLAEARGLPVLQPERLRDPAFQDALGALAPELALVEAYVKILPPTILAPR